MTIHNVNLSGGLSPSNRGEQTGFRMLHPFSNLRFPKTFIALFGCPSRLEGIAIITQQQD